MGCKLYANEVRSRLTLKLPSMFNEDKLFLRSKLKDARLKKFRLPKYIKNRKIGEENKFSVHVDLILILPKRRSLKHSYGAVNVHVTSETIKIQRIHLLYRLKQRKEIIVKKNFKASNKSRTPV